MTRGAVALMTGLALGAIVSAPSPARACGVCNLRLTHRTGPYRIVVANDGPWLMNHAPRLHVTIINPGPRPLVLGGSPASLRVTLNSVTPYARYRQPIPASPSGRSRTIEVAK